MKKVLYSVFILTCLAACTDNGEWENKVGDETLKIVIDGEIDQVFKTRANDSGFADGDVSGAYIVDYNGTEPGVLATDGNRANNLRMTFNASDYKWDMAYDVYFKDQYTNVDIYGYYPFVSTISNVNALEFSVAIDQTDHGDSNIKSGYETSDFLWGKTENITPEARVVHLKYAHRMASAKVVLLEGEGFSDGEWAALKKQVTVKNTKLKALIDLKTGTVTATGEKSTKGIIPYEYEDFFRAIVVPQSIPAGEIMFVVNIGNVSYKFSRSEDFEYIGGKMHNFTFKVDKKGNSGEYEFSVLGESILAWENDDVAHDASLKEYVIINNEVAGHLDEAVSGAGKSLDQVRNLKITGVINSRDFAIMRFGMEKLQALNMKDVKIVAGEGGEYNPGKGYHNNNEDEIPNGALSGKETLTSLILPDQLKAIRGESGGGVGRGAFSYCSNLSGSLIIPEGVEIIEHAAFNGCSNLCGTLSLPSTLKRIGSASGYTSYWDGPFNGCGFVCELILPEGLKEIGMGAFSNCRGLYGELKLPDGLTTLGSASFSGCSNLTGSLVIPQGVTLIPDECFAYMGLNGNLTLHDGICAIGSAAFARTPLKGALELPDNLRTLSHRAFSGCDFSGELKLPSQLEQIGNNVFGSNEDGSNWRLMGTLEIPQNVISIGEGAFFNCWGLEGLILPEGLENIKNAAFYQCYGIGSIVCKSTIPPHILGNAFDGVPKDNFTLEVPESAVMDYKTDPSWKEFKRIAAHHELVVRPSLANALNTACTRTLVLNAEGDWEVTSMPDWVSLSASSGRNKTELTLSFSQMSGEDMREGDIVFNLKSKNYQSKCHVSQYDYAYGEDEIITLQKATKGKNGGINLVFLGDGYDAKDISEGTMLANVKAEVEDFFSIEPYATYRNYFNVFTAIPVSTESGIGTINTIRYAKFETTFTGGVGLRANYDAIIDYAQRIPEVTADNLSQTTVVIVPNSSDYGGICYMWDSGFSIAFCPQSDYGYPFDTRGVVQHEAGGHGFGKLGDEYIYHNEFIDMCPCTCCPHVTELASGKAMGWFENLSLTGKMHEVGWSHLIFDDRYSNIVDIFEGGYMHTRGVYRSEQNSCMNNDIPYFSTISRESIVKRIKRYAGEPYSFEEFVSNDRKEPGMATRGTGMQNRNRVSMQSHHATPVLMKGSPVKNYLKKVGK